MAILFVLVVSGGAGSAATGTGRCGDPAQRPWCDTSLSPDERAGLLLNALTRDEKTSLLAGDSISPSGALGDTPLGDQSAGESGHTGVSNGVARVGIPPTYYSDGPQGVRQGQATGLPSPMGLAAAWDPRLAAAYGAVIGNEAKSKGNDVVFGPTVNIMRTPLNSRTFESYGEDPFLSGRTAVGWIHGVQSEGVMANVKHFAAYNQEGAAAGGGGRFTYNAVVDERTLREIYLPQFEAAIKEGRAASVMCSYNRLNGQYACENQRLLNDILAKDWGFKGYVLADYGAAKNTVDSLNNGLDFDPFPGLVYSPAAVNAALAAGQVSTQTLDERVRRILRTMFAYGFFDRAAYLNDETQIDKAAHARVAGEVEDAAITLLRNDGVLPLDAATLASIALIGPGADSTPSGGGSAGTTPYSTVTPRQGITERAGPGVEVRYDPGSDAQQAAAVAKDADVAIVVVNKSTVGSLIDDACLSLQCSPNEPDQDGLIEAVVAANPNTIVVLETAAPVLTPWRDKVRALMEAWYPGGEGGNSLARVLFGDVDPGGRLPTTFPKQEGDLPTAGDPEKYPGVAEDVHYKEGVFVGYRWYDAKNIEPAFPFGYGLSYTTFAYDKLAIRRAKLGSGQVATVSLNVTNAGDRPGTAVPQLYLGLPSPRDDVQQPPTQLKGFQKVHLQPGKTTRVTFTLDERALSYWDVTADDWRVAPGCYTVMVGSSSRDIHQTGILARNSTACGKGAVAIP